MFERATKIANHTITYQLGTMYFILLNLLWRTVGLKLNSIFFFGFIIIIVLLGWYGLSTLIRMKLKEALQEIDQDNYMPGQIKKMGWTGVTLAFMSPLFTFVVSIFTINNYMNW